MLFLPSRMDRKKLFSKKDDLFFVMCSSDG